MTQTLLAAREGFHVPGAESFYGRPIIEWHPFGIDASINRTVVIMLAGTALVFILFALAFRKPQLVPRGIQNVMEFGVDFVKNNIVLAVMGPKGLKYLPYLTTLFFFILFLNWFEVVPFLNFPPTSRLAIPLMLAIITWLLFVYAGVKTHGGLGYLKSALVPPGVPKPILLLLVPVEFLTVFILRPVTLTIRLTANMIAGHLLLVVFFLGTAYLIERQLTIGFGVASAVMSVAFVGFELFVGGLQAFIFTILTAVYIQSSLNESH